jgi:GT2 family glycosyltransferase
MPTAVLDLDLDALPPAIDVPACYEKAYVLLRLRGRPVGEATIPLLRGRVAGSELRRALFAAAGWPLWEAWLADLLGVDPGRAERSPLPGATVAVCTRDRPDDLRRCLDALLRMPDDGQEILVVDNCPSTEATREVVDSLPGVRYVREPRPGLDRARNRALREARHEIVAFIDDDAVADPGWLRSLLRGFDHPRVLCVTGLTPPYELETETQEIVQRYFPFGKGFKRVVFDGARHDPLSVGRVGAGANMALRRDVLALVGPFDEALDAGTATRTGGDHEMFSRILRAGYRIVYEPSALNWHRHRRTLDELRSTVYGYGVGVYATWTRDLLVDRELGVARLAWAWLRQEQLPGLVRSLLQRDGSRPLPLVLDELRGCLAGPKAYLTARRQSSPPPARRSPRPAASRHAAPIRRDFRPLGRPSLSLVMPTHNRADQLAASLDALATQTLPPERFEVIVVADGCTDRTAEVVRDYRAPYSLHIMEHQGSGPAVARNRGALRAEGQYLVFLDDDIEASPDLLAAHLEAQQRAAGQVVVGYLPPVLERQSGYFRLALGGWWEAMFDRMREPGHRFAYSDLLSGNFSVEAALFRRVGGFDPALRCHEDYELGLRLIEAGGEVAFAPEAMGRHHENTDLDRALRRKRAEGRADVMLGRRHPRLRPTLPLSATEYAPTPLWLKLRTLAFSRPAVGDALASLVRRQLDLVERLCQRARWHHQLDTLLAYWYWRGVAQEIGSWQQLLEFVQVGKLAATERVVEVDLDLADGLVAAERRLDEVRPDAARIAFRGRPLGLLPAQPGVEPLRGTHLRPSLATALAWPLLSALALDAAAGMPPVLEPGAPTMPLDLLEKMYAYQAS